MSSRQEWHVAMVAIILGLAGVTAASALTVEAWPIRYNPINDHYYHLHYLLWSEGESFTCDEADSIASSLEYYKDVALQTKSWTGGVSGGGALNVGAINLYSDASGVF